MTKARISLLVPNLEPGGVERMRVHLANEFSKSGYKVDLVVAEPSGSFMDNVDKRVNVVDLGASNFTDIGVVSIVVPLWSYLRETEPTILISSMNHVNIFSLISWRLSNTDTRIFISDHNPPAKSSNKKQLVVNAIARMTYEWADEIIAVSQSVAKDMSTEYSIAREEISVINNPVISSEIYDKLKCGVNHSWFDDPEYEVILHVGRLHPQKDQETLLRAFDTVHKSRPQARLVIIGDGERRKELENLAIDLGLKDHVEFLGYLENPYKYMSKSDVFVLTSVWEGFGNVIVEAMACGCPVVSTECLGPREILSNGQYGKLAPIRDNESIAEKIIATLDSSIDSSLLHKRARSYTTSAIAAEYINLF